MERQKLILESMMDRPLSSKPPVTPDTPTKQDPRNRGAPATLPPLPSDNKSGPLPPPPLPGNAIGFPPPLPCPSELHGFSGDGPRPPFPVIRPPHTPGIYLLIHHNMS